MLNQLLRVDDPNENATWVYEYDLSGNIVSKTRHAYTVPDTAINTETNLGVMTDYSYTDPNWKDKLTKVGDAEISYDEIGNPTMVLGAQTEWSYAWQAGRCKTRIASMAA